MHLSHLTRASVSFYPYPSLNFQMKSFIRRRARATVITNTFSAVTNLPLLFVEIGFSCSMPHPI